jgi:hypothetical protein
MAGKEGEQDQEQQQGRVIGDEPDPFFELDLEARQTIIRSLAREEERLTKRRKDLEADGLKLGVKELDQHLSVISRIKRQLAPQLDAFEQTPMGEAMARGESMHQPPVSDAEPIAGEGGDEITMPDGSRIPIDMVIGRGDNPGEWVVNIQGGPSTIFHAKDAGQWRVVSLEDDYPLPKINADDAAQELQAAAAGDEGVAEPIAQEGVMMDRVTGLAYGGESSGEPVVTSMSSGRKRSRTNKPSPIGAVVKKEVSKATGERKHRPAPKSGGRKRGK